MCKYSKKKKSNIKKSHTINDIQKKLKSKNKNNNKINHNNIIYYIFYIYYIITNIFYLI